MLEAPAARRLGDYDERGAASRAERGAPPREVAERLGEELPHGSARALFRFEVAGPAF